MVNFGESDRMIKISDKVGESNTTCAVVIFRFLLTE